MDEGDLTPHFAPFTERPLVEPSPVAGLARRAVRRRRIRRIASAAGVTLVVAALVSGVALAQRDTGTTHTRTVPASSPEDRSTTTPVAPEVHPSGAGGLVISKVPDGFDVSGCSMFNPAPDDPDATVTRCKLTSYRTGSRGTVSLFLRQRPAEESLLNAWRAGDAATVTKAVFGVWPTGTFRRIGSVTVLDLGSTGVRPATIGQPASPERAFELLLGDRLLQVNSAVLTDGGLAVLASGLGTAPIDLGFDVDPSVLPVAADVVSRSIGSLWVQTSPTPPVVERMPGQRAMASFQTLEPRRRFTVALVTGADITAYLASVTTIGPDPQGTVEDHEVGGRRTITAIGRPTEELPGTKSVNIWIIDGADIIEVTTGGGDPATIEAIAAGITVHR